MSLRTFPHLVIARYLCKICRRLSFCWFWFSLLPEGLLLKATDHSLRCCLTHTCSRRRKSDSLILLPEAFLGRETHQIKPEFELWSPIAFYADNPYKAEPCFNLIFNFSHSFFFCSLSWHPFRKILLFRLGVDSCGLFGLHIFRKGLIHQTLFPLDIPQELLQSHSDF